MSGDRAHDSGEPGAPAERRRADAPRTPAPDSPLPPGSPILCDLCGNPMLERHCRIVCTVCGYQRDCSDP
ncbi:MAG: hypothetical protein L0271_07530 [Gemmatimonadetes bacterium]|nr:hypothetical protein [Gemmatimonadota bacterium]